MSVYFNKEYQIILEYIEYLLANFRYEFEKGYGIPVLEGQASFYRKNVRKGVIEMTKEEILQAIERQKEYMRIKEMSDDMYYTYGTYEEDRRKLNQLKNMLK